MAVPSSVPIRIDANSKYVVYPNPSSGSFILKGDHLQGKSVMIYNMLGEVIFTQNNTNNDLVNFNIENIKDGMYKVILSDRDGNTEHLKLIIKN